MRSFLLIPVSFFLLLTVVSLYAGVDYNPLLTQRATALLQKLQVDISPLQTPSLVDFSDFKKRPITGHTISEGWNTYYRCGYVRFTGGQGGGGDISGGYNSVAVMRPDSLYLSLTVASGKYANAANKSFDLFPYMPGCRLFIFYRENLVGQVYPNSGLSSSTERKIDRIVAADMEKFGIKPTTLGRN